MSKWQVPPTIRKLSHLRSDKPDDVTVVKVRTHERFIQRPLSGQPFEVLLLAPRDASVVLLCHTTRMRAQA
jgi:hypothetical protein